MANTRETKLKIDSWDEKPYRELPDGALLYYRPDGTSSYVTLMTLEGELDGRNGSFVLRGDGAYDGTTARGESTVVPGSGTGALAGIIGTAVSESTHADYPFMPLTLTYELG
jgi:hypothetical protein